MFLTIQIVLIVALLAVYFGFFGSIGRRLVLPLFIAVIAIGTWLAITSPSIHADPDSCGGGPTTWDC